MEQTSAGATRRSFLRVAGVTGAAAVTVACGPAQAPAPSPAVPSSPGAAAGARPAWQMDWDSLVAAAKQEAKLVTVSYHGNAYRKALNAFELAFPGITVDHQHAPSSSLFIPKVTQERKASVYSFDILSAPASNYLNLLLPGGAFESLRSAIIKRPDVVDDKNWRLGFEYGFVDKEKQYCYMPEGQLLTFLWINTDMVKPEEFKSGRDLLDPKWKGKIVAADVRSGNTNTGLASLRKIFGDDFVRRLVLEHGVSYRRTGADVAPEMVRGAYPVGIGFQRSDLTTFLEQGVGKNLKALHLPEARTFATLGGKFIFNRAPHPNAAKLFINWALTKEGQAVFSKETGDNSLRTDVPPAQPEDVPTPGMQMFDTTIDENDKFQVENRKWLEDLMKG